MKQKTATGAKDPRHLSSIAPTVAHAADGTKVGSNCPFRASIPNGFTMRPGPFTAPGSLWMAFGAEQRYHGRMLTKREWKDLLHEMRFAPGRIVDIGRELHMCYPKPLGFDEWADLFAQLAAEHVLATKYGHPR